MRAFVKCGLAAFVFTTFACQGAQTGEGSMSSSGDDAPMPGGPAGTEEMAEVVEVARTFLSALSAADTATLATLMAPGASIHSVREGEPGPALGAVSRQEFLKSLANEDRVFLERMWDPVVRVQAGVAMVWTPYDFYLNGEFSHCGTDVFTLLRGGDGWQVTGITYNVVQEGCPTSPLGPPIGSD